MGKTTMDDDKQFDAIMHGITYKYINAEKRKTPAYNRDASMPATIPEI